MGQTVKTLLYNVAPELQPFVNYIKVVDVSPLKGKRGTPVLAPPSTEQYIKFSLGGSIDFTYADQRKVIEHPRTLGGIDSNWLFKTYPEEGGTFVIAGMTTAGLSAPFGVPATEVSTNGFALEHVLGRRAIDTHERLFEAKSRKERAKILHDMLLSVVPRMAQQPAALTYAIRLLNATQGKIRSRELAARCGITIQQMNNLFRKWIGVSTKQASQWIRLHFVLDLLEQTHAPQWSDFAARFGFADQAHLIRSFKELMGMTPEEYEQMKERLHILKRLPKAPSKSPLARC